MKHNQSHQKGFFSESLKRNLLIACATLIAFALVITLMSGKSNAQESNTYLYFHKIDSFYQIEYFILFLGVCLLPKETGPCRALIISYFYDKETKQCAQFNYGGCGGNENRFSSMSECQNMCS